MGRRDWMTLLVALGTALALTGCTVTVSEQPGPANPASGGVDRPVGTGSERQADEQSAVEAVNRYWQRHFRELSRQPYEPPQIAGPYRGRSGPGCGGERSVPFNAYYCPVGDYLAWDEDLMRVGYDRIGDAWIYLIIAHEWGHAIQARLHSNQVSVAAELQADCFAGAALYGSVRDGDLILEPGDQQEIAQTLVAVADDYPWTDAGSHGNAQQRVDAFALGASRGLAACT